MGAIHRTDSSNMFTSLDYNYGIPSYMIPPKPHAKHVPSIIKNLQASGAEGGAVSNFAADAKATKTQLMRLVHSDATLEFERTDGAVATVQADCLFCFDGSAEDAVRCCQSRVLIFSESVNESGHNLWFDLYLPGIKSSKVGPEK